MLGVETGAFDDDFAKTYIHFILQYGINGDTV